MKNLYDAVAQVMSTEWKGRDAAAHRHSRAFRCRCGNHIFFRNSLCLNCSAPLGYLPERAQVLPLDPGATPGRWRVPDDAREYKRCTNLDTPAGCNWVLPAEPRRPAEAQGRPSMVRTAVALLLQHPELAATADTDSFRQLDRPGMDLLVELIGLLKARPDLKPGAILEHYRGSDHPPALARLAVWEHPALAGDVAAEFSGVLDQLRREVGRDETERLLNKERLSGLTPAEKAELKRLLAERHSRDSV